MPRDSGPTSPDLECGEEPPRQRPRIGRAVATTSNSWSGPWSLRDRFDERTLADMIADYRAGTTATFLGTTEARARAGGLPEACRGVRRHGVRGSDQCTVAFRAAS